MKIGQVYKCQLIQAWFTRTMYCGKYLYALHFKLSNPRIDVIEKIQKLGEDFKEVKRLALYLKINTDIDMNIKFQIYNTEHPFYVRKNNFMFISKNNQPQQFFSWAFPIEVFWDEDWKRFSSNRYDDINKNIRYMYDSGRFVKSQLVNGKYIFPNIIDNIQSYKTEKLTLDDVLSIL